jgi:hypothetical protein
MWQFPLAFFVDDSDVPYELFCFSHTIELLEQMVIIIIRFFFSLPDDFLWSNETIRKEMLLLLLLCRDGVILQSLAPWSLARLDDGWPCHVKVFNYPHHIETLLNYKIFWFPFHSQSTIRNWVVNSWQFETKKKHSLKSLWRETAIANQNQLWINGESKKRTWKRAEGWLATGSSLWQLTGIDDDDEAEGARHHHHHQGTR